MNLVLDINHEPIKKTMYKSATNAVARSNGIKVM